MVSMIAPSCRARPLEDERGDRSREADDRDRTGDRVVDSLAEAAFDFKSCQPDGGCLVARFGG